jgi:hypothetical protein
MTIKRINELPEGSGTLSSDDILLYMDDPSGTAATKKIAVSQLFGSVVTSSSIKYIVALTQAEYDALVSKNAETLYVIT